MSSLRHVEQKSRVAFQRGAAQLELLPPRFPLGAARPVMTATERSKIDVPKEADYEIWVWWAEPA